MCSVPLRLKRIFNYRVSHTSLDILLFLVFLQRIAQNRRLGQPSDARSVQAQRAEDLSGVLGRGLGMPLRGRHLWELQGVLQEGRGRSV